MVEEMGEHVIMQCCYQECYLIAFSDLFYLAEFASPLNLEEALISLKNVFIT